MRGERCTCNSTRSFTCTCSCTRTCTCTCTFTCTCTCTQLRTHYTLYHFWDHLVEEFSGRGEECTICCTRFPTHDHLLQVCKQVHQGA